MDGGSQSLVIRARAGCVSGVQCAQRTPGIKSGYRCIGMKGDLQCGHTRTMHAPNVTRTQKTWALVHGMRSSPTGTAVMVHKRPLLPVGVWVYVCAPSACPYFVHVYVCMRASRPACVHTNARQKSQFVIFTTVLAHFSHLEHVPVYLLCCNRVAITLGVCARASETRPTVH
jgi:hypothetical protein